MSKSSEYRQKSAECLREAEKRQDPAQKAAWLRLAGDWLRMVGSTKANDKFDAAAESLGTGQEKSTREH